MYRTHWLWAVPHNFASTGVWVSCHVSHPFTYTTRYACTALLCVREKWLEDLTTVLLYVRVYAAMPQAVLWAIKTWLPTPLFTQTYQSMATPAAYFTTTRYRSWVIEPGLLIPYLLQTHEIESGLPTPYLGGGGGRGTSIQNFRLKTWIVGFVHRALMFNELAV